MAIKFISLRSSIHYYCTTLQLSIVADTEPLRDAHLKKSKQTPNFSHKKLNFNQIQKQPLLEDAV